MKIRFSYMAPFFGIILVFILYSAYWVYAKGRIEDEVTLWIMDQESAGYTLEQERLRVTGFPYRFKIEAVAPQMRAPIEDGGWSARLEGISAHALPYDFSHWIIEFEGPVLFQADSDASETLQLEAGRARISLNSNSSGETTRIGAEIEQLSLEALTGPATAIRSIEHAIMSGQITPDNLMQMLVEISGLETSPGILSDRASEVFGAAADTARIRLSISQWSALAREGDAAAWSRAGGEFRIAEAQLEWGPAQLSGSGDFTLDEQARPNGLLSLNITDPDTFTDALVEGGLFSEEQAMSMRLGALMSPRGPHGTSMTFRLHECRAYFGPVPLGEFCE